MANKNSSSTKKLCSFMIECDQIEKIKAHTLTDVSFSKFLRNSIDFYLMNSPKLKIKFHEPLESMLYYLQHDIQVSIEDYTSLFNSLDLFYGLEDTLFISDTETVMLAFCAAKLLQQVFGFNPLHNHPERSFAEYFIKDLPEFNKSILPQTNFVELMLNLHHEQNVTRFSVKDMLQIISTLLREDLLAEMNNNARLILNNLTFTLIKLIKPLMINNVSNSYYGFEDQILENDI